MGKEDNDIDHTLSRITVLMLDVQKDVRVRIRAPRRLTSREWDLVVQAITVQRDAAYSSASESLVRAASAHAREVMRGGGLTKDGQLALAHELGVELGVTDKDGVLIPEVPE
jgi:hypothetical protein